MLFDILCNTIFASTVKNNVRYLCKICKFCEETNNQVNSIWSKGLSFIYHYKMYFTIYTSVRFKALFVAVCMCEVFEYLGIKSV